MFASLQDIFSLETWSKEDARVVIRFFNAKGLNPSEILIQFKSVYVNCVISLRRVYRWWSLLEKEHYGLAMSLVGGTVPLQQLTMSYIEWVEEVISEDRRLTLREIDVFLEISQTSALNIVFD